MKSSSKKYANLTNGNPLIGKLLKLKYAINDAYRDPKNTMCVDKSKSDKSYVMSLISDVREYDFKKLSKEDGLKCNSMWREYEGN